MSELLRLFYSKLLLFEFAQNKWHDLVYNIIFYVFDVNPEDGETYYPETFVGTCQNTGQCHQLED
jgi:hypothetical protein